LAKSEKGIGHSSGYRCRKSHRKKSSLSSVPFKYSNVYTNADVHDGFKPWLALLLGAYVYTLSPATAGLFFILLKIV
jgi:hypothetical protein